jgi:beta-1,3-glucuronyltransferase
MFEKPQFCSRAKLFVNSRNDVVYFADADYTYDPNVFEEIRTVSQIGMFPVGLTQPLGVQSPVVGSDGKVVGFLTDSATAAGLRYPISLAGFSVGLSLVRRNKPQMAYRATWEAESFLRSLGIK